MSKDDDTALRQTWVTPPAFMDWMTMEVLPWFGCTHFTLDVCATADNARAPYFIGPPGHPMADGLLALDGLAEETPWDWEGHPCGAGWCNPGYKVILPWAMKAVEQALRSKRFYFFLTHNQHSTDWYRYINTWATAKIEVNPRIAFLPPPGVKASQPSKDNYVFVFDPENLGHGKRPARNIYPAPWRT